MPTLTKATSQSAAKARFSRGRGPFDDLMAAVRRLPGYTRLVESLGGDQPAPVDITGTVGSLTATLAALAYQEQTRPTLILVDDPERAGQWHDDLTSLLGEELVARFPSWETLPYEFRTPGPESTGRRLQTLWRCLESPPPVVVAHLRAALEPTLSPGDLKSRIVRVRVGEELGMESILSRLVALGYRRCDVVEEAGAFAARGGIIDFFTFSESEPVRIEFFGDAIESIRTFSVSTQRTTERRKECTVLPGREALGSGPIWDEGRELTDLDARLLERLESDPERPGLEWLAGALGQERGRLFDYFGDGAVLWADDPSRLQDTYDKLIEEAGRFHERLSATFPEVPTPTQLYGSDDILKPAGRFRFTVTMRDFRSGPDGAIEFDAVGPPSVNGRIELLSRELDQFAAQASDVVIGCDNRGQADRLTELLEDRHTHVSCVYPALHRGFVLPSAPFAYLTEHEIFNRHKSRSRLRRFQEGLALSSYTQLKKGDYVVHVDHGIGRFRGLESITVSGRRHDCLLLHYQGADKLFVPVEEFDRVQKYSGKDSRPSVARLGGTAWERTKNRAKKALLEMAEELVALYAARKALPAIAYSAPGEWMQQLEDSFPYDETPDQAAAIREVGKDMGDSAPMDRLVCGDVGYGKTEVAIRAAFRAICDHKQVCVLVPTTILAQQHLTTFRDRLAEFPARIETLSRFRSRREQLEVVDSLARGKVDIVIGTHRLLQKDIRFADLGLLIIDEEHRFGVRHKERMRQMKQTVDTLALSATPIPRTLQMSLLGARDLSMINTSPRDRLPVRTEVRPFGPDVVTEAVLRELDRGGQVYFVHNRIQSIAAMADYLQRLMPSVRIGVAHGQMPERQLESVMVRFYHQEFDMLLSTAIIESGLDLPSVNTIVIHRADHFGLAQLYQLRGRVGRAARQAYAYLLIPPTSPLTSTAKSRLQAIEEHTALGSGFHLAMRDLEIRGAGNLLGPQQHGFIEEVGFDLYCRLLDEAVAEVRGSPSPVLSGSPIQIEVAGERFLPDDYVPDNQQRFEMYKRMAELADPDAVDELLLEMTDRFGAPPPPARRLAELARARVWARRAGLARALASRNEWRLVFPPERVVKRRDVERWRAAIHGHVSFDAGPPFCISVRAPLGASADMEGLVELLRRLDGIDSP